MHRCADLFFHFYFVIQKCTKSKNNVNVVFFIGLKTVFLAYWEPLKGERKQNIR